MNARPDFKAENTFEDVRKWFVDAGVSVKDVLPLVPPDAKLSEGSKLSRSHLGKVPGVFHARTGLWSGMSGGHFREGLGDATAHECGSWLTGNLGLRGAVYPAIDSDVQSEKAARAVDRAIADCFGLHGYGIRTRDGSPRSLYAFLGSIASRPAAIIFHMPDDPPGAPPHVVEVIGRGKHYVAAGIHPNGSKYRWERDADLCELIRRGELMTIGEADVARFLDRLERVIEAAGGKVLSTSDGRDNHGGEARDYSGCDPIMPVDMLFRGLARLPNTERNFPTRESLVGILGSIRAALGREAEANEDRVREWAVGSSDGWCREDEDFEKVWSSLDRGVRVSPDTLSHKLRSVGFMEAAALDFPDDEIVVEAQARDREWLKSDQHRRRRLRSSVAHSFLFCEANTADGEQFTQIRPRRNIAKQRKAIDWRMGKALFSEKSMLDEIDVLYGKGEDGLNTLLQELQKEHPECFFVSVVRNPLFDIGAMIEKKDLQGNIYFDLNERPLPLVQKLGAKMPKGSGDPSFNEDVALWIEFVRMMFGVHADYELNCLADMAQTGRRPGNMLFLMGDSHTGKTMYADALSLMFDGTACTIAGGKLKDSMRFILVPFEGARIGQIIELPSTLNADTKAALDSLIKIIVDASRKDSTFPVEAKTKDIREVPNYLRLVATSNFQGVLYMGEQDRRIFYVVNGINRQNTPPKSMWDKIDALMKDERRLASVWRYFLDRDTTGYDRTAAPPLTSAKIEAQRAELTNPVQRHARDAVSALVAAQRVLVDTKELGSLMTAMAHNEWQNSGRKIDDRPGDGGYSFSARGGAVNVMVGELAKVFSKLAEFKSGSARLPTVYVRRGSPDEAGLIDIPRAGVLDRLHDDRSRNPILEEHMGEAVRGPTKPPIAAGAEFD